ncbi:MAG: hypothetical protein EP332_09915 [Bacteroidetes bacterium]|nr:MAG: hypothetical protein EP332_09915 [Bacteroidota bacterium]
MKILSKLSFVLIILGFTYANSNHGKRYQGGRTMYSSISIDLNDDNTYYLSSWMHPARYRKDTGTWERINAHRIKLNSTVKTCFTPERGSSEKYYYLENQKCEITDSTLNFIPKKRKDRDFYRAYYSLRLKESY